MKKALLLGTGPSSKSSNITNFDEYDIFRINSFFLEDGYPFGKDVKSWICGVYDPVLFDRFVAMMKRKEYNVESVMLPFSVYRQAIAKTEGFKEVMEECQYIEHWNIMAKQPAFARLMMNRPFPTSGIQLLSTLSCLGYKKIAVSGVDFYLSEERYAFTCEKRGKGHKRGAHSIETDFAGLIAIGYSEDLNIEYISDSPGNIVIEKALSCGVSLRKDSDPMSMMLNPVRVSRRLLADCMIEIPPLNDEVPLVPQKENAIDNKSKEKKHFNFKNSKHYPFVHSLKVLLKKIIRFSEIN